MSEVQKNFGGGVHGGDFCVVPLLLKIVLLLYDFLKDSV